MASKHPRVIVVSGPSGVGKSSLVTRVLEKRPDIRLSVSMTTRRPRKGEVEGVHYHFVTHEQFEAMIDRREFMEWARVYDNYYGTHRPHVEQLLAQGFHVLLDVDTQGAMSILRGYRGPVLVFILPPNLTVLESRLRNRGTENPEELAKRLAKAEHEISFSDNYNYRIINDSLEEAVEAFLSLIAKEGELDVEFSQMDILPGETLAATTEKAVQYALERIGQEGLVQTLKKDVKRALASEIEELIRERLSRVIQQDLPEIVAETYRVFRTH
ncbi:MAG: guanylate kinase [Deltaproteobacteria bacterium]|nr:guanylate kinase [Deltaproteobacteria bacterium]